MLRRKIAIFLSLIFAININANNADMLVKMGKAFEGNGKIEQAIGAYQLAGSEDSKSLEAHSCLARALYKNRKYDLAEVAYRNALKVKPENLQLMLELGNTLILLDKTDEAIDTFMCMLILAPNCVPAMGNVARILSSKGNISEAIGIYEKMLTVVPNDVLSQFNLSLLYLTIGEFKKGFAMYNGCRWTLNREPRPKFSQSEWDGSTSLYGKCFLICSEQGLGDMFQFIRYAKKAKALGATVIAQAHKPLVKILSLCPYLDIVIQEGAPIPEFDTFVPLVCLPEVFQTTVETIPSPTPYLFAKEDLVKYWKHRLSEDKTFKVGICWQGMIEQDSEIIRHFASKRSFGLDGFKKLIGVDGVTFYSLQKEHQNGVVADGLVIKGFGDEFDKSHGAFMDTAAIMKNLDLVITIDTSIAHLAGGLGVKTWVILPYEASWRWLIGCSDTPWYSTMKLFRQKDLDDKYSVFDDVKQELKKCVIEKD